ncbi:hypothetical protein Ocin01_03599 [Orchesella cincta]|uniref:Uncharacterized protein n=1 Tax=Orchesella cincta TaxID=48709 RepID=A0A1D2NCX8_ORCCI|nr:hypothetical protein Ocin01_03599 [Orchesella cincta]
MSYVTRRKSRRKFKHQPTNVDGLSQLLTKCSASVNYGGDGYWQDVHDRSSKTLMRSTRSAAAVGSTGKREKQVDSNKKISSTAGIKGIEEEETHLDNISFRLGSTTYEMDDTGHWKIDTTDSDFKAELLKLRQASAGISQENNLLRVKNELLTDMIAKKKLRQEEVEQELQRLKKILSKSSSRFSMSCDKGYTV